MLAIRAEAWILNEYCKACRLHGEWVSMPARDLSPSLPSLLCIKFGAANVLDCEEQFTIFATDEEVLGLVRPRHRAIATPEQIERLLGAGAPP